MVVYLIIDESKTGISLVAVPYWYQDRKTAEQFASKINAVYKKRLVALAFIAPDGGRNLYARSYLGAVEILDDSLPPDERLLYSLARLGMPVRAKEIIDDYRKKLNLTCLRLYPK